MTTKKIGLISIGIIIIIAIWASWVENQNLKEIERDEEITALTQKIIELENKPSPEPKIIEKTVTIDNTKYLSVKSNEPDLSVIIAEWTPRIAFVVCEWAYDGIFTGSATLARLNDNIYAMTNAHVIESNGYIPNECLIMTTMGNFTIDWDQRFSDYENPYGWGANEDYGYIRIDNQTQELLKLTSTPIKLCKSVNIGDKLVVLGYPGAGSQESITATEGIISGIESNYYVTSAKIESGNSGGAAILLKDNCYLGIPSYVEVGNYETLARILKAKFVLQ